MIPVVLLLDTCAFVRQVILLQAYKEKNSAVKHLGRVASGDTLAGSRNEAASAMQHNRVNTVVQLYYVSGSAPLGSA